jgi:hypothetical protein
MNTKEIEAVLKEQALKLKKGNDKQKAFGKQLDALINEIEKYRKASEKPWDENTVRGPQIGGGDSRLQKPRTFTPNRL